MEYSLVHDNTDRVVEDTLAEDDAVQLGIDFRGGEEMIFRCVKIRIECNRSWQKKPNAFKYVTTLTHRLG